MNPALSTPLAAVALACSVVACGFTNHTLNKSAKAVRVAKGDANPACKELGAFNTFKVCGEGMHFSSPSDAAQMNCIRWKTDALGGNYAVLESVDVDGYYHGRMYACPGEVVTAQTPAPARAEAAPPRPRIAVRLGMSLVPAEDPAVEGVVAKQVAPESPAERAGFVEGDVVVEINGMKVTDPTSLEAALATLEPEQPVKVNLLRKGKRKELSITPEAKQPRRHPRLSGVAQPPHTARCRPDGPPARRPRTS